MTATRLTTYWYGSVWQGTAQLDGRPGRELAFGRTQGAHTLFYTALTWRRGALVGLKPPRAEGPLWVIDGAWSIDVGWQHRWADGRGVLRRREAERIGRSNTFRAGITTYQWTTHGWRRLSTSHVPALSETRAEQWGGFQIPGLRRYL